MSKLNEGDFFTIRIKDGIKIIIKANNKCSMYHVYEDFNVIKEKLVSMKNEDVLFFKDGFDYQMILKQNGKISNHKI